MRGRGGGRKGDGRREKKGTKIGVIILGRRGRKTSGFVEERVEV